MRRIIEDLVEKRKARQEELKSALAGLAARLTRRGFFHKGVGGEDRSLSHFLEALTAYVTALDKEWDAYASNHASTVFKSLEWKISKLEAEYSHLRTLQTNTRPRAWRSSTPAT